MKHICEIMAGEKPVDPKVQKRAEGKFGGSEAVVGRAGTRRDSTRQDETRIVRDSQSSESTQSTLRVSVTVGAQKRTVGTRRVTITHS